MSKLQVYGYYIMNFLSRGAKIRKGEIAADSIVTKYGAVLTRKYIRRTYIVKRFTPLDIGNPMGRIFRSELLKKFPGSQVIVQLHNTPKKINVKEAVFLRRYSNTEETFQSYAKEFEGMSGSEQISGKRYYTSSGRKFTVTKKDYLSHRDTYYSYKEVTDCVDNQIAMFEVMYSVQVLIPSYHRQEDVDLEVANICAKTGLLHEMVESKTAKFLGNYGITSVLKERNAFPRMLFSAKNIALNSSYLSPGLVGGGGVLHGVDKRSGEPLTINYFVSGGAKVCLLVGESGSGKTQEGFNLALQFIGQKIHCSVLDYKGNEWNRLRAHGIKIAEFEMNNKVGSYVNLLRLDDIVDETMTEEEINDLVDMATTGTVKLLSVMVDIQPNEGHPRDVEAILREAVDKLYSNTMQNKSNKKEMAKDTAKLHYKNVIEIVREFGQNAVKQQEDIANYDKDKANLCRLIIKRCTPFVESYGMSGAFFKKEITFKEVLDAELVIYSMGKNAESQTSLEDTVRVFMIEYMDIKKQYWRKRQHLMTVAFYEEVQRLGKVRLIVEFLSAMVTGGRSNNLAIFLLLNSISAIDSKEFSSIRSNITLVMGGKMKPADKKKLIEEYDCWDIKDMLDEINPEETVETLRDSRKRTNFGNCFAVKFRKSETEYDKAIFKLEIPPDVKEIWDTADYVRN